MIAQSNKGVQAILAASIVNVGVSLGFYYAHSIDSTYSPLVGVGVRVLANLIILVPFLGFDLNWKHLKAWPPDSNLYLWGLFGALTVFTYFISVTLIGASQAMIYSAGGNTLIVMLGPRFTGQPFHRIHFFASLGIFVGMLLLFQSSQSNVWTTSGIAMSIISGFFAALAFLMVARGGTRYKPSAVVFHWTAINLLVLAILIAIFPLTWPKHHETWVILGIVGIGAAASQVLTAVAYQQATSSLVASLSYLAPCLTLFLDAYLFNLKLSSWSWLGALILLSCAGLILLGRRRERPPPRLDRARVN